jgi:hypothetical protein
MSKSPIHALADGPDAGLSGQGGRVIRRFGIILLKVALAALAAALVVAIASRGARPRTATALVPAYFYPSGAGLDGWNQLARDARSINIDAILNPASGPGTALDPKYVAVVNNLRSAGGNVFGYVSTRYGNRDMAAVIHDIMSYIEWYNINGIFVDEMANTREGLAYYEQLYCYIRALKSNYRVIGNPGMPYTLEGYLRAADTLVVFEGPSTRLSSSRPLVIAPWFANYPPERFANIVYAAKSTTDLMRAVRAAGRAHAGAVFITDGALPNPYQGLPAYWAQEVAAIWAQDLTAASRERLTPLEASERRRELGRKTRAARSIARATARQSATSGAPAMRLAP